MSDRPPDVSALIVNYRSGHFVGNLVDTLLEQEFSADDGQPGTMEILLVDNASPEDQRPYLEPLAARGVAVEYLPRNSGYSGGVNHAARRATGRYLFVVNPDALVGPGALQSLLEELRRGSGRVGLVGPRGYLDPACFWSLPAMTLPTLGSHLAEVAGHLNRWFGRRLSDQRSRTAWQFWKAPACFSWPVVSGYGFLMPASLARELGPFDESFPLYYEDADLCRRLVQRDFDLRIVPAARMIHLYNRSAGQNTQAALARYEVSVRYYMQKHHGRLGRALFVRAQAAERAWIARRGWDHLDTVTDLGDVDDPPAWPVIAGSAGWLAEISVDPCFFWAAGHAGNSDRLAIPRAAWDCLDATQFYLRVIDAASHAVITTFAFRKTRVPVLSIPALSRDRPVGGQSLTLAGDAP